jgi:hypothetical protein
MNDVILHSLEVAPLITDLSINKENILKGMGMQEAPADEFILGLMDELVNRCREICCPMASYTIYQQPSFDLHEGLMLLGGKDFKLGSLVTSFFKKSTHMAVFISTCGQQIENFSHELMDKGHLLEGLIVDLAGSEIADQTAKYVHRIIEQEAIRNGLNITNRYSPGYCNWPVSDQHKLFALINGDHCGISLTESSLMIPIKSVSGMVGLGKDVKYMGYRCKYCPDEKCLMRNNEE